VPVTLVTTVQQGLNDDQLGRIVTFGLNRPNVRGVNFQPLAFFGRHETADPAKRITMTGVLRRLEAQLGGMLKVADFIPLPCDVDRVAITVLLRERSAFVPLTRKADVDEDAAVAPERAHGERAAHEPRAR
jgi:7,8-dihydro-6-hydroxymethylpterin dimethyltransferase